MNKLNTLLWLTALLICGAILTRSLAPELEQDRPGAQAIKPAEPASAAETVVNHLAPAAEPPAKASGFLPADPYAKLREDAAAAHIDEQEVREQLAKQTQEYLAQVAIMDPGEQQSAQPAAAPSASEEENPYQTLAAAGQAGRETAEERSARLTNYVDSATSSNLLETRD